MSSEIKSIAVAYDAINESNTFSNGDFITGRVTLEVGKETKINKFLIKAKGKASVLWSESYGQVTVVYHDKETCFKSVHFFIQERKNNDTDGFSLLQEQSEEYCDVVSPGVHVYPFTFQIPQGNMPSSFKGSSGKVVYFLEAKLCRSMRLSSKGKTKFTFLSKTPEKPNADMNVAQHGMAGKNLRFLNSGSVSVNASVDSTNYYSGDDMRITAEIQNNSSRSIKPKFCLYQKQSFFAMKRRRVHTKDFIKEEGEPIDPSSCKTVSMSLRIPQDTTPSILNCRILKVEYRLKVYLDVKYSKDPAIKFPVTIFAPPETPVSSDMADPPQPYSDFSYSPMPSGNSYA